MNLGLDDAVEFSVEFPSDCLVEAEGILSRVNAKLVRNGLPEYVWSVSEFERPSARVGVSVGWVRLLVSCPLVRFVGWRFVASLVAEESGYLVNAVPGADLSGFVAPEVGAAVCEHCGTRRTRKRLFVVEHEDGRRVVVGSSCVDAFLGCSPEVALLLVGSSMRLSFQGLSGGSVEAFRVSTELLVALGLVVSDRGVNFVSRSVARGFGGRSTADCVSDAFSGVGDDALLSAGQDLLRDEPVLVADVIAAGLGVDAGSDYGDKLRLLLSQESVLFSSIPIVVSAVSVWVRAREVVTRREREAARFAAYRQEAIGSVQEKLCGQSGIIEAVRFAGSSEWGDRFWVTLNVDGYLCSWRTDSRAEDWDAGQVLSFSSGRVKSVGEFRGVPQSVLTNLRGVSVSDAV